MLNTNKRLAQTHSPLARSLSHSLTRSLCSLRFRSPTLPGNNNNCLLGVVSLLALPAFAVRLFNCSAKPSFVCIASRSFDRTRRVASRHGRFARVKSRSASSLLLFVASGRRRLSDAAAASTVQWGRRTIQWSFQLFIPVFKPVECIIKLKLRSLILKK